MHAKVFFACVICRYDSPACWPVGRCDSRCMRGESRTSMCMDRPISLIFCQSDTASVWIDCTGCVVSTAGSCSSHILSLASAQLSCHQVCLHDHMIRQWPKGSTLTWLVAAELVLCYTCVYLLAHPHTACCQVPKGLQDTRSASCVLVGHSCHGCCCTGKVPLQLYWSLLACPQQGRHAHSKAGIPGQTHSKRPGWQMPAD